MSSIPYSQGIIEMTKISIFTFGFVFPNESRTSHPRNLGLGAPTSRAQTHLHSHNNGSYSRAVICHHRLLLRDREPHLRLSGDGRQASVEGRRTERYGIFGVGGDAQGHLLDTHPRRSPRAHPAVVRCHVWPAGALPAHGRRRQECDLTLDFRGSSGSEEVAWLCNFIRLQLYLSPTSYFPFLCVFLSCYDLTIL